MRSSSILSKLMTIIVIVAPFPASTKASLLIAKLCRNQHCRDTLKHPILDYSEERGCHCAEHPCWNDNGLRHTCDDPFMPYLTFHYENDILQCQCSATPHYEALYIAKTKCPGHFCNDREEHPVLDYDEELDRCVCRSHPCWELPGEEHKCEDPNFPILHYREETNNDDEVVGRCECLAVMDLDFRSEL